MCFFCFFLPTSANKTFTPLAKLSMIQNPTCRILLMPFTLYNNISSNWRYHSQLAYLLWIMLCRQRRIITWFYLLTQWVQIHFITIERWLEGSHLLNSLEEKLLVTRTVLITIFQSCSDLFIEQWELLDNTSYIIHCLVLIVLNEFLK